MTKHTPTPFKLKFTDMDAKTGEIFNIYETENHGWENKANFIASIRDKNGNQFQNGYSYLRKDIGVITKVEAVDHE
jgi:hypothetical protein